MLRSFINKCKGTNGQNRELEKKKHAKDLSVSSLYICKKKKNLLKTIKKNYIILSSKAKFLLTSPSGSGPELILLTQKAFFLV